MSESKISAATSLKVVARLSFYSAEEGGRTAPFFSGYRPNHKFDENSYYCGIIRFSDAEKHFPGDAFVSEIIFMISPGLLDRVHEGYEWDITEGGHIVGRGKILSIVGVE